MIWCVLFVPAEPPLDFYDWLLANARIYVSMYGSDDGSATEGGSDAHNENNIVKRALRLAVSYFASCDSAIDSVYV